MWYKVLVRSHQHSFFKTIFGMPSGPIALCTHRRFNNFNTPLLSIIICEIGGVLLNIPTSGLILSFDIGIPGQVWYLIVSIPDLCTLTYFGKYRDELFKSIFALDLASVSRFRLLFNGAIPILSCLLLFV